MNTRFKTSKDLIYFDESGWAIPTSSTAEVIYSEHDAPEGFNFIKISKQKLFKSIQYNTLCNIPQK